MKLFIFDANADWSYCGGAVLIIANSFENCQKLMRKKEEDENKRTNTVPDGSVQKYSEYDDYALYETIEEAADKQGWTLFAQFPVAETEERILLHSYQYA